MTFSPYFIIYCIYFKMLLRKIIREEIIQLLYLCRKVYANVNGRDVAVYGLDCWRLRSAAAMQGSQCGVRGSYTE